MKAGLAVCWLAAAGSIAAFQATGSIEGQIVNAATGSPLKRANVRLAALGRGRGGGPSIQMRETDDQGRFAFGGLDAGRYQLTAERQGFLRQSYGGRRYNTSGTPIALAADQRIRDVVLKMSPHAVIAGKVIDEDGEPVANVQVRALKMGYRNGRKQWVQAGNGSTSDIGEYRIASLEPGKYLVATSQPMRPPGMTIQGPNAPLPDTAEMRYANTYYPSTPEEASAVPVDVPGGGEIRGIDIRLAKTRVFRVRGRVVVAGDGGRNFPMVMLVSKDGSRAAPNMAPARPPDYRFEIAGVAPGSYIVYAQMGGRGEQAVAFQPVEVQNRHADGLVLAPAPGGDVAGAIKVEDANGPVDLSRVNVLLRPAAQFGNAPRARVTDGAFVLKGVSPLRYDVTVGNLPEGCYLKSMRYGGREVPEGGIDMAPGGALEITLSATAGAITATAVDKEGKASGGVVVALVPKDGGAIQGSTADENGAASFNGLKPGEYVVIAWEDIPPGAYQDPEFVKAYSGSGTTVKLEPRAKQVVQVKAVAAE